MVQYHYGVGLPDTVLDDQLEQTCLNVLEDIGCGKIKTRDVHACHRLKNRKKVIIRFVNRKCADKALINKSKLKTIDKTKYGLGYVDLYINENLCPALQFLAYKVRLARKAQKIAYYNIWKGKLSLKLEPYGEIVKVGHMQDLIELGLAEEKDRADFLIQLILLNFVPLLLFFLQTYLLLASIIFHPNSRYL